MNFKSGIFLSETTSGMRTETDHLEPTGIATAVDQAKIEPLSTTVCTYQLIANVRLNVELAKDSTPNKLGHKYKMKTQFEQI